MKNNLPAVTLSVILLLTGLLSVSISAQTDSAQTAKPEIVSQSNELSTEVEKKVNITPSNVDSLVQTDSKEFSPIQSNEQGIAIDGYDTVAYFDEGKAVRGNATHSCEYLGREWHFSSAANRDKFLQDPEKFAPLYGGYCAHSITDNKLVRSNPESFAIKDGQLHLYVNDRLAKKDSSKDKIKFNFDKKLRDNNWLTYQAEF